ncbi:helix-hairpin-helix domain-containing protein (plasmid) [Azospirillum argentinense]|uniref:Helix-hairpin-helix domain-containing protein n=5 Tax=Azospirillum TaxID=191 RepID=A0A4D8Q0M6_AZOBR|nr:helix-hairpin-helix domain-containing protein [Azospirillum argentinense]QCO03338.1 helix-hairpin-helix domain-containing protein [Azospirillum argentinense]
MRCEGAMNRMLKVDLNRASKEQLLSIPGIGEEQAAAIIDYRKTHGRFRRVEEIALATTLPGVTIDDLLDRVEV